MSAQTEPYDSLIECPLCRDDGLQSHSGRIPHLFVDVDRDPPMICPGVHGQIPAGVLRAHGIAPVPVRDTGSGLAPSAAQDAVADHPDHARQEAPAGPPDDVSELEQESAYRDSPKGDVATDDHTADAETEP